MYFEQKQDNSASFKINLEINQETINLPTLFEYKQKIQQTQEPTIPLAILKYGSGLEIISTYLKQQNLKYSEIAKILNRDQRTIWTSINKKKTTIPPIKKSHHIPTKIFQNRELSILEAICEYLQKQNYSVKEIAHTIKRNQQTIHTILRRIKNKRVRTK